MKQILLPLRPMYLRPTYTASLLALMVFGSWLNAGLAQNPAHKMGVFALTESHSGQDSRKNKDLSYITDDGEYIYNTERSPPKVRSFFKGWLLQPRSNKKLFQLQRSKHHCQQSLRKG